MNADLTNWEQEREAINRKIEELRQQGLCYSCHDLATGEVFGTDRPVIYEDELFKIVPEIFPRAYGHTIVLYKPHREDVSELSEDEAAKVFQMCVRVVKAIKQGLGAEKVYLNTMCDGEINHLHLQLFPRYAGEPIGSKRFVAPRGPLVKADEIVAAIRAGLIS